MLPPAARPGSPPGQAHLGRQMEKRLCAPGFWTASKYTVRPNMGRREARKPERSLAPAGGAARARGWVLM